MHQIGLALQNFSSTFNKAYPPAAQAIDRNSTTYEIGGYSVLVRLTLFMDDLEPICPPSVPMSLGNNGCVLSPQWFTAMQANILARMIATSMKEFTCPSYSGPVYNLNTSNPQQAITNYKAMGASCKQSLAFAQYVSSASNSGAVPYNAATIHPDGAIYPSTTNLPASQFVDGLSHTIFLCETVDNTASCWVIGSECVMTGLPGSGSNSQGTPCSVPTGTTPAAPYNYFTPAHYDGTWGDSSGVTRAGMRTFLMYDCSPSGADAGAYARDGDPGASWTTTDQGTTYPTYGPSSMHPGVVIAGFGDGSAQPLSKRIDAANFFFLITKSNADPFYIP